MLTIKPQGYYFKDKPLIFEHSDGFRRVFGFTLAVILSDIAARKSKFGQSLSDERASSNHHSIVLVWLIFHFYAVWICPIVTQSASNTSKAHSFSQNFFKKSFFLAYCLHSYIQQVVSVRAMQLASYVQLWQWYHVLWRK